MAAPTEKQMAFRNDLIARFHGRAYPKTMLARDGYAEAVNLALAISLPTPATAAECSEQIDALKTYTLLPYAKRHRAWAEPVVAKVDAAAGEDGSGIPARRADGTGWTAGDFRSFVAGILA